MFWVVYQNKKRGLELAFGAHCLHDFSIKMFLIKYFINGLKFKCHTFFPSQDIKENVFLSFHKNVPH